MNNGIIVSVLIAAYNHEKYIREAIESALMQRTNFNYEILIHDDASTDRTPKIIKEYEERYPFKIKPIYESENQFSKGLLAKTLYRRNFEGRYFAILDGDDYWTDCQKLQAQVDFLEAHPDYSMCMHNAVMKDEITGETKLLDSFPDDGTYTQEEQVMLGLGTDFPAFASFLFRTEFLKDMPEFFIKSGAGDYAIRQYYANCGKVYYSKKPMSVYRSAVPQSFMSNLRQDADFYGAYTLKSIRFFEQFDIYTDGRFSETLRKKIISEYIGYCSAIKREIGVEQARELGMDMSVIDVCYDRLSREHIDGGLQNFCENFEQIFIYGASRLGRICGDQLKNAGIAFDGFVVSDGQNKLPEIDGKPVYGIGEVMGSCQNPCFILAIQPINKDSIVKVLNGYHTSNYYDPYALW